MQTITPFLWFNNNLEEAINFYAATFKDAKITNISRQGPDGPAFMTNFEIQGQEFMGLNGGPMYKFTEAVSFFISCDNQEEVDYLWERLSDGGEIQMCGWLKDKFGVSWQVIPKLLMTLMSDGNPAKSQAVMGAMMEMKKIESSVLQAAFDGAS
ncbi:MAG: VOC family protein [Armatimonadota bacterium]